MPPDDDSSQRIEALERKVARLEQELTAARLSGQRASVQQALMDERLLTLERNRLFRLWGRIYRAAAGMYARIGSDDRYGGLSDLRTPGDYERWVNREQQELAGEDHRGTASQWRSRPLISVCLSGNTGALNSARSVFSQCYSNWELCVPAQLMPALKEDIERAQAGSRTRIVENAAAAAGEYLLMLHAGDCLSPHALHFYAQALQDDSPDMLYADEDTMDSDGVRTDPLFKPGWSPELLRSTPYLGRAILCRGGINPAGASSLSRVHHIPRVLHHRASSIPVEQKSPTYAATAALNLSLIICSREIRQLRECVKAVRSTAAIPIELLVVHHLESGNGDRMRQCVEQFGGTWIPYRGPFDFARMNNLAAAKATAPHLLFMNDDVIVQQPGWDQALSATLTRAEIGIAGAVLQYPNGTVQHAGVVVGMGDAAGHCGRFQMSSGLWPWLRMSRDVTAVTGAMLGIRSELFRQLQGFDEAFPVNYNDVDLCLRAREAGLRVVCLDLGNVVHRESQTRVGGTLHDEREALYQRWPNVLARPDEFYSPNLAPTERIGLNTGKHPLKKLGLQ
jgi:GT2 family glycosyltransferase